MSVSLPKEIFPSLKTVYPLCLISSAMLFLPQSLKYFLPLPFIYLRLGSIPISSNFQTFPVPHPGPGPERSEAPALHFGNSKHAEEITWEQMPRIPCSGARLEAGQSPKGAQGRRDGLWVTDWGPGQGGSSEKRTLLRCHNNICWAEADFTSLCLLMGPVSDSCHPSTHVADNVVRPSEAFSESIREGWVG